MGPLKDQMLARMPWLFDQLGFRVTASSFSANEMGASHVEMENDSLRLKFEYDGLGYIPYVAPHSDAQAWIDVGSVWHALTGTRPNPQLDGWAWFVRDHLRELSDAMNQNYSQVREQFEQARSGAKARLRSRSPAKYSMPWKIRRMLFGPSGWILAIVLASYILIRW